MFASLPWIRVALANSSLASYQAEWFQKDVTAVDYCVHVCSCLAAGIWCCIHVCAGYIQPWRKPLCVEPLLVTVLGIG